MFCPSCGKSNPDDSKFCESCGSNMNEPSATPPVSSSTAPPPPPPPVYQPVQPVAYPSAQNGMTDLNKPMGVGGYLGMILILFAINLVPILGQLANMVLLFIWSFGSAVNTNKKNLARAILILMLILIAIGVFLSVVLGSVIMPLIQDLINQMY